MTPLVVENLTESLKHAPWLLWLGTSLVAGMGEVIERGRWLGMIALAAVAGAMVALAVPGWWWLQAIVAVVALVAGLVWLRPYLLRSGSARSGSSSGRRE